MFFLRFAEFNLKSLHTGKRCITQEFPCSCAPPPFRSIYSQDWGNFFFVNVALKNAFFSSFFSLFLLLLSELLSKAQFNLVPADILKNHGVHPVPLGKKSERPCFFLQINVSSTINMQSKGSIKSLPFTGHLLPFYELMKLGVLAK